MYKIEERDDISLNDKINYMSLEQKAAFLAGIDCHGKETRTDVERWKRILESSSYLDSYM